MPATHWRLSGQVQGVGFRPFVYRLAHEYGLAGWVRNRTGNVEIRCEGPATNLEDFGRALLERAPPLATPRIEAREVVPARGFDAFAILPSGAAAEADIHVPPDYFTCDDCLKELADPRDRRYRYPFINCTQCGPRYTLIARLPYDRPNTSMAGFELCPDCRTEYENPLDRRFHAEPVACPVCGPQLQFVKSDGAVVNNQEQALATCAALLRSGMIVAVKGIGGYHLVCDAANDAAISRLRAAKPRPHKPLALMVAAEGADGLDGVRRIALPREEEGHLLRSPQRPIVLMRKKPHSGLSSGIAPGLNDVGVMLAYSPLHHLLLQDFAAPLVATSANLSGEPVLTDEGEVHARLGHVADAFLHHDRPILRPADDPVFRFLRGAPRPIRLGRGCAPLEIPLPFKLPHPVLAVGAHMKNTITLAWKDRAVVSPHIGEMDTPRSLEVFTQVIEDLQALYKVRAEAVVRDAHPAYTTSRWAERHGLPVFRVFHHHAHASALAGESSPAGPGLVFTWDGVGYGEHGALWGGETLLGRPGAWRRVGRMRPFRLPGGEKAAREPWRGALGICWEVGAQWPACPRDAALLHQAWQKGLNSPLTTAVGRLFDAAAALTGILHAASFEGQGPMYLEAACGQDALPTVLPVAITQDGLLETDWQPLLAMLMDGAQSIGRRSGVFHASMAGAILDQAIALREQHEFSYVGLTGGVFQNRILTEQAVSLLEENGLEVKLPKRIPVNDAGISFGQVIEYGYTNQ